MELVQKPVCCFLSEKSLFDFLGVEYLVAVLRKNGYATTLMFDEYGFMPWKRNNSQSAFCDSLMDSFREHHADIVFISVNSDYYRKSIRIASALKQRHKNLLICVGGPHPTYAFRDVLDNQCFDFVCRGEGEIAIIQLLEYLQGKREDLPPGIYRKKNGFIEGSGLGELVADLDSLPFPEKEDVYKAWPHIRGLYTIASGRGCYNNCTYCNSPVMRKYYSSEHKAFFRRRSVDNVIAELRQAKQRYNISYVAFCDDTFIYNKKYMIQFAERYASEISLPFGCQTNPNFFDRTVIKQLIGAGLIWVQTGAESLDSYILKNIFCRKEGYESIRAFVEMIKSFGVYVRVDHLITPWDNRESLKKQVLLYNQMRPSWINLNYLSYYPETEIINMAVADGYLVEDKRKLINTGEIPVIMNYGGHIASEHLKQIKDVSLLLNWLPVLPKFIVRFLISTDSVRVFQWLPVRATTLAARIANALFDRKDHVARFHLKRIISQYVKRMPKKKQECNKLKSQV